MINDRIRELRESTGMSARKFAETIGIKYTTYYGYETGAREPGSDFIVKFADYFGVTTDYILGIDTKKSPEPEYPEEDKLSMDELVTMLSKAGFLDDNGDLSDTDLRFLMAVGEMIRNWFADRK